MAWNSIRSLAEALPDGTPDAGRNIDGLLTAVAEDIVEAAARGGAGDVAAEYDRLRDIYDDAARQMPLDAETTPAFRAGQIAMAVETLGALRDRIPSQAFKTELHAPRNQTLLALLQEREWRHVDLAATLNKDPSQITHMLKPLREIGVVVSQKSGREVFSRLSMAARVELEGRATVGAPASGSEHYARLMQRNPVSVQFPPSPLPLLAKGDAFAGEDALLEDCVA